MAADQATLVQNPSVEFRVTTLECLQLFEPAKDHERVMCVGKRLVGSWWPAIVTVAWRCR